MKKALLIALLVCGTAFSQTTTITGTIKNLDNSPATSGQVIFTLMPGIDTTLSGVARFNNTPITCNIQGDGTLKNQANSGACVISSNTALSPPGTYYAVAIQPAFITPGALLNMYAFQSTVDITTVIPSPPGGPSYPFSLYNGGTVALPIVLPADPTTDLQAADKHYVDKSVGMFNASLYATIQAAITAAGTTGSVYIPATYPGADTFTNPNSIPIIDMRYGTVSTPRTDRTFVMSNDWVTLYDASSQTTNAAVQGDGRLTPVKAIIVRSSGAGSPVPLYLENDCGAGSSGGCYGQMIDVEGQPGANPDVIAHNWVWKDNTFSNITGCTRTSNVATCTITGFNPYHVGNGVLITGNSNAAFNTGRLVWAVTAIGAQTFSFASVGANISTPGTGGVASPNHIDFVFEIDAFNNAKDPTDTTPVSAQNNLPIRGLTMTSLGNLPISEDFFSTGSNHYNGFLGQDAITSIFTAGYPVSGGGDLTSLYGFRANPRGVATAGVNKSSMPIAWADSVWSGSTNAENYATAMYVPDSSANNSAATLKFTINGLYVLGMRDNGQILMQNATAGLPTYSFQGDATSGMYRDSGGSVNFAIGAVDRFHVGGGAVTSDTGLVVNTTAAKPTCAVGIRGMFWVTQSGAGVKDAVEVCAKDAANAYAWRTIF